MSFLHVNETFRQQKYRAEHPLYLGFEHDIGFHNQVLSIVSNTFNVKVPELRAPTRLRKEVALARQVAMYLTHIIGGFSLSKVGKLFNRDRTTAAHACRVVEDMRDDPNLDHALLRLESILSLYSSIKPSVDY